VDLLKSAPVPPETGFYQRWAITTEVPSRLQATDLELSRYLLETGSRFLQLALESQLGILGTKIRTRTQVSPMCQTETSVE
jgi:hypothetical protein